MSHLGHRRLLQFWCRKLVYVFLSAGEGVWSGGAMVLGKLPVAGRPAIRITIGQGPTTLAVGAGGCCLDIFFSDLPFLSFFSLSLGDGPI